MLSRTGVWVLDHLLVTGVRSSRRSLTEDSEEKDFSSSKNANTVQEFVHMFKAALIRGFSYFIKREQKAHAFWEH